MRSLDDRMVVGIHQYVAVDYESVPDMDLTEQFKKMLPVPVIGLEDAAFRPSVVHMVPPIFK